MPILTLRSDFERADRPAGKTKLAEPIEAWLICQAGWTAKPAGKDEPVQRGTAARLEIRFTPHPA